MITLQNASFLVLLAFPFSFTITSKTKKIYLLFDYYLKLFYEKIRLLVSRNFASFRFIAVVKYLLNTICQFFLFLLPFMLACVLILTFAYLAGR